jgi:hypothetical protein
MMAQVKTETSTTQGQANVETNVERGVVVSVSGNDLIVKMEDGQIENFPDVPDIAKISVDGQQLSVHDLKPGMKLERTITTTTTPQTVTTVKTVTGRVFHVSPPSTVTLKLEDGTAETFTIPAGQKFMVDGQEKDAFGLKKGMQVSATKIITEPTQVVSQEQKVTGQMPPQPQVEAVQGPVLIESKTTEPEPAQVAEANPPEAQPEPKELPKTAGALPSIALIGALMLLSGLGGLAAWSRRTRHGF